MRLEIHHDYETFCELDVRKVGAFRYAQHESCDVLMLAWFDPRDGKMRQWFPHLKPTIPRRLLELVEDPEVEFHAHNAQFEYCIWKYVMTRRYGCPEMGPERFVCTSVQGAASGLPRSLENVGKALSLDIQKDKEGSKLINLFCKYQPARKPSKKNPEGVPPRRITPDERPDEWERFAYYNRRDVETEIEVANVVPRLSKREQRYFALDLTMNTRGLPLDMKAVRRGLPVLTELERRCNDRVVELTGGIRPSQREKMLQFFNSIGLDFDNLQAKTIKDHLLLKRDELSDDQVELLLLRVEGGKASTKKLKTMLLVVCEDGRVRGGFLFYGAHTGRWSGKLIQPQNFPRGEYKPHQLEQLIQLLYLRDPDVLEMLYEHPIDAVAQGMRGFIKAPPGRKLVVSDFAAIEARMLAWLADEKPQLELFAKNGDVYVRMAAMLYRRDEQEMLRLKKLEDKETIKQRKFGKDIVLGCWGADTPVITDNGVKRIVDVLPTDRVWDGVEWVATEGPAYMGDKEVIELCGQIVTPDHKVFDGQRWHRADALAADTQLLRSAISSAYSQLPPMVLGKGVGYDAITCGANVAWRYESGQLIFTVDGAVHATPALSEIQPKPACSEPGYSKGCSGLTSSLGETAATTSAGVSTAAMSTPMAVGISETDLKGHSASPAKTDGADSARATQSTDTCTPGSQTCTSGAGRAGTSMQSAARSAHDGTTSCTSPKTVNGLKATDLGQTNWNSTDATHGATTNRTTADSSRSKSTSLTSVYDLVECGPRNRFTILTPDGPLIVHNCGYQMGGPGFYRNCIQRGILVSEEECNRAVKVYRKGHPAIVKFWYDTERCAIQAVKQGRTVENPIKLRHLKFYTERNGEHLWFVVQLPSGRKLRYYHPKVQARARFGKTADQLTYRSEFKGKIIREPTYGGKLVENITQAVARDVMVESMERAEQAGYPVIGTVHDELICEVDTAFGSAHELEQIMSVRPKWAKDAPIGCEGWEGDRYRK